MATDSVFLDIGAHDGGCVAEALGYGFRHVHAFEPMPREFANLKADNGSDGRVSLHNFGLSDFTGQEVMYGTNDGYEASVYRTQAIADNAPETVCDFVDASDWFVENIDGQQVFAKINCEGSEADIFESLMESGEIEKIAAALVCFDIALVPGQRHREAEVRDRFGLIGFDRRMTLMATYQGDCVRQWLEDIKAVV